MDPVDTDTIWVVEVAGRKDSDYQRGVLISRVNSCSAQRYKANKPSGITVYPNTSVKPKNKDEEMYLKRASFGPGKTFSYADAPMIVEVLKEQNNSYKVKVKMKK